MMKKLCSIITIVLVFAVAFLAVGVYAQDDHSVTLSEITANDKIGTANIGNNGSNYWLSMGDGAQTSAISLGSMDLSKYSQVQITYGTDVSKEFGEAGEHFLALTTDGAPSAENVLAKSTDKLLPSTGGSWTDVQVNIDLTGVNNNSTVWIAYNVGEGGNAGSISITKIVFIADTSKPPVLIGDGNDYNVVLSELDTGNIIGFPNVGNNGTNYYLSMGNNGVSASIKLGAFDLSKFSSLEIIYGTDGGALFADGSDTYIALTKDGATNTTISRTSQLAASQGGSWTDVNTTIDLTNVDYQGDVWITYNIENISGRLDSISVTGIKFVAATEPITMPVTNPNTADNATYFLAIAVVLCIGATIIHSKKLEEKV